MKKLTKKLFGIMSTVALVGSMTACSTGTNAPAASATPAGTTTPSAEATPAVADIVKPEKITIMVNGTLVDEASGRKALEEKFKEITGVQLDVIQPDHNAYNDQLAIAFTSGMQADVVILSAEQYPAYAAQGALWDMSEAWNNSETKASGRVNEDYMNSLFIDGSLYAFTTARGNGCVTYMRQDWLDNLGLKVPTTYEEYLNVLRAFTTGDPDKNGVNGDTYGVTAAGIIGTEAPFTNYLPEFWQDAYPSFYKTADGTWVDGFSEEATAKALQRLKDAYAEGVIDMEVATNKTSACRDKFYASKVGTFTYWAGKWNATLEQNLQQIIPEAKLVALPPIKELGTYIERQSPVMAITGTSKNPEGVFKYFVETMLDGDQGQMLFTYGAEGTHWEVKDGVYKQLPDPEVPDTIFLSAYTDPVLSISKFTNGDPLASQRDQRIVTSDKVFVDNSVIAPVIVSNDVMASYAATLLDTRTVIVADVVTGTLSVEDGMAKYKEQAGSMIDEILDSLNK